jgi:Protein of unknown function (DUF4087)
MQQHTFFATRTMHSRWRHALALVLVLGTVLIGANARAQNAAAAVWRCGWFENPTPANAWLTDRDGEWLIAVQGGHQAEGDWPTFSRQRRVRSNGNYGHGCACLKVVADAATGQVQRIVSASSKPLAHCRKDRRLREPKPP